MENLKVLAGVATVMVANLVFHYLILTDGDVALANRIGVSAYVLLVMVIGGRIVPSFTRNWLNKMGKTRFPVPFNRYDGFSILVGVAACIGWIAAPDQTITAVLAWIAALFHIVRLYRWRGGLWRGKSCCLFFMSPMRSSRSVSSPSVCRPLIASIPIPHCMS